MAYGPPKYGIRTPHFMPYEPFLLGVGVVSNLLRLKCVIMSVISAKQIPIGSPRCNCSQRVFHRNCCNSGESSRLGLQTCISNCNLQKLHFPKPKDGCNHFDDKGTISVVSETQTSAKS